MNSMSFDYWVAAIIFLCIGLLISLLLKKAESYAIFDVNGNKHYSKGGKGTYFLIFVIMILFVILMKPSYGMEPYIDVFNISDKYEVELFSLKGLYSSEMEPMFLLWCYCVRLLTSNVFFFFFFSFSYIWACVLFFISSFIRRTSFTITFMIMWPVLIDFVFGLRYAMGVSTCLLAMTMMQKKHFFCAAILIVIACFTHFLALSFIMYLVFFLFAVLFFKKRINSKRFLLLALAGVYAFSIVSLSIFQTFRFAYRMSDQVEINNYISYAPMVFFALVIMHYNKKKTLELGDNLCATASYFNMIMIPLTISWGIYRLPYLFLLPIAVELSNVFGIGKSYNPITKNVVLVIIIIFSIVKIITTGVQNMSLDYTLFFN